MNTGEDKFPPLLSHEICASMGTGGGDAGDAATRRATTRPRKFRVPGGKGPWTAFPNASAKNSGSRAATEALTSVGRLQTGGDGERKGKGDEGRWNGAFGGEQSSRASVLWRE